MVVKLDGRLMLREVLERLHVIVEELPELSRSVFDAGSWERCRVAVHLNAAVSQLGQAVELLERDLRR